MWYMSTVHAYDALDRVHVTATVRATVGSLGDPIAEVYSVATTVPGVGEDDPNEWLRDALVALLEVI
jgi:hypothetical protein